MKHFLPTIIISLLANVILTGCGDGEYLGSDADAADVERGQTISFNGNAGKSSRASMLVGPEAAAKLDGTFVVFGTKTTGGTLQTVFDHYTVVYGANTAMTTASNSSDWEYVGQTVNSISSLAPGTQQTIKYWDFSADQYDFVAFSTADATQIAPSGTPAAGEVAVTPVDKDNLTSGAYRISGDAYDITKCYFSDRLTAVKSTAETFPGRLARYREPMSFVFRPLAAKVRLGLFETVNSYSVKDVRFYTTAAGGATPTTTPALFASTATIPNGATTAIVKFPETNKANDAYNRAQITYDGGSEKTTSQSFGALTYGAPEENEKGGNIYLGRTSSDASLSADATLLPTGLDALNLKVDFTLVSIDYNETINIKGASATVPAAFTQLQPNTSYTYLFKITDAVTDAFGQKLLYPIQFDALEITDDVGEQHTMTTIDQPSITTYAKGQLNTNAGTLGNIWDYYKGDRIYISVMNGSEKFLTTENSKLFRIKITDPHYQSDWYEVTEQNIFTNISAINADTHWFTMTDITTSELEFVTEIDAADSPTGDIVSANNGYNFARFTANDGTANDEIYAFRYKNRDEVRYTQDEIDDAKAIINAGGYVPGSDPYAEDLATKTAGDVKTPTEYHYKVIRVQNAARP